MPTGQPDFLAQPASNPTSQTFAAGEDTTRINMGGGSNSQSGRWIWATGFESGLTEVVINGASVALSSVRAFMGAASLGLITQAVLNDAAFMSKTLYTSAVPGVVSAKYGAECMIALSLGAAVPREFDMFLSYPGRTSHSHFRIVLVVTAVNNAALYIDNNGVRTLISDVSALFNSDNGDLFHFMKAVFDGAAGTYTRVMIDNLTFDLGGAACFVDPGVVNGLFFTFTHTAKVAAVCSAWLDNVIITADEV